MLKNLSLYGLILLLLYYSSPALYAQETTAIYSGYITDTQGQPIKDASVTVTYEPTQSTMRALTNLKGHFVIPNLKPGGPYTATISFVGHVTDTIHLSQLNLGENPEVTFTLKAINTDLATVIVSGSRKQDKGNGTNISRIQINTLPTLSRSISDFTKLTPQSNNNAFAGTSFRYNNITLDGAVNNDAIGFSNSFGGVSGGGQAGTAGAGTRTTPYSLDVIQEVQVQLAPFDVRLGNFTGGSVNAVTKSGANDFHGSIYYYGRNHSMVGKSVDGLKQRMDQSFSDYQYGATLSGPIVKNKLFFIANAEITRRQEPTFYNAGDPGSAISIAEAQDITNFLHMKYNYDPGTYDRYNVQTNSEKFFGRIDWNINNNNSFMLRGIYTNGYGNNLERTSTNFQFSSTDFIQHTKNINIVGELKSKLNNALNNNLILSYINVHEYRDFPGALSPFIDIGGGKIWLGTWREASIYNMKQKTFEFTDNLTWVKDIHKFTLGTHNEFYNLNYGFINAWNGRWEYAGGLSSFLNNQPSRIRGSYAFDNTKNDRNSLYKEVPGGKYSINLLSAYTQDEIKLNKHLKITAGIRVDYAHIPKQPGLDTTLTTIKGYPAASPTYTHTPWAQLSNQWLNSATFSPRIGFNIDIKGNQSLILRGGSGIFVGRMPFAWLGYAYTLSGNNYGNIDYKPSNGTSIPLAMNPQNLKDTISKYGGTATSATHEVNIVDNHFKLPTIWRSNIAFDLKFARNYKLTVDALYTKTLYDVKFQQINIQDTVTYFTSGPSQSPIYVGGKANTAYSNVYLLTNTKQGHRYNFTIQLSKAANNIQLGNRRIFQWNWMIAYTYGISKDISNGVRNSFQSNFELNPAIVANDPQLAYSNFDLRHRIIATISASLKWNNSHTTSLALFFASQSGSPYSVVYSNGNSAYNNAATVSLPFIPANAGQINLADVKSGTGTIIYSAQQQWNDLNQLIEKDPYLKTRRGKYAERNGLRTPWNQELNLKFMHEIKWKGKTTTHTLQVSADIFNVLNLLSNDWGHIAFVSNVNNYTANLLTFVKDANDKSPGKMGYIPTFNFNRPTTTTGKYYTIDPINSRWQAQLGIRYSF